MTRDLMFKDEIESLVIEAYRGLDQPHAPSKSYYGDDDLRGIPDELADWALGVGNPVRHADPQPGQTVLDLGCGSGLDVLLAARSVGSSGAAIGIDMLPEMVERARTFAGVAGLTNTDFLVGKMDDIPMPDDSVDVVISNGSISLAARKSRVFAEARRVLKPGGQLCVADLVIDEEDIPPEILTHPSAWAG